MIAELVRVTPKKGDRQTLEDWRRNVGFYSHGMDVMSPQQDLGGEISKFDFAGATLWSVASGPQIMRRVRANSGSAFRPMAIIHVSGAAMRISQGSHRCDLSDGSFTFIDSSIPHEIEYTSEFRQLVLQFPPTAFGIAAYRRALGKRMNACEPLNTAFYQCVLNVWKAAAEIHPLRHSSALAALISLGRITAAISEAETEPELPIRVHWAMEFIEQHLGEAALSPQMVADAQQVSRRYLDALFITRGHRLQTWIWERRLERAAEDLRLNNEPNHNILQVALDHGFKTPSHFSRTFAKRFGLAPREYRRQYDISRRDA
jgi:AraC family transcriptional activator of tynA and feaB